MKLLATLAAVALAGSDPPQADQDWTETIDGPNCGSYKNLNGMASINSTCTLSFNGLSPDVVQVSAVFVTGTYTVTGFDGATNYDDQGIVVEWAMAETADGRDNSTCGSFTDISFSCVDHEAPVEGTFFQGFHNTDVQPLNAQVWLGSGDHAGKSLTYNFAGDCDAGFESDSQAVDGNSQINSIETNNCTYVNVWDSTVTLA